MLLENEKKEQIILESLVAIAIVGSLVLSTLVSNASILPLMVYLFVCVIKNKKRSISIEDANPWLAFWYGICFISCGWGYIAYCTYDIEFPNYTYNLQNYCFKLLIFFIPLWLLFTLYDNRDVIEQSLYRGITMAARFMLLWALVQLLLWETMAVDFNQVVFGTLFGQDRLWSAWVGEGETMSLRLSGVNPDAAFLGFTMLLGVIFDRSKVFKALYVGIIVLSMSRTAIIGLGALFVYLIVELIRNRDKLTKREKKYIIIGFVVLAAVAVIAFIFVPWVRIKVMAVISRFDFLTDFNKASMSSRQHIMYIPYAFKALFMADPIQALIGVGARMSGVFLTSHPLEFSQLPIMFIITGEGWTIECDLAEVIIGTGLLGAIAYYGYLIYLFIKGNIKIRCFAIMLAVTGLMYTYAHQTITHIMFITLFLIIRNEQGKIRRKE